MRIEISHAETQAIDRLAALYKRQQALYVEIEALEAERAALRTAPGDLTDARRRLAQLDAQIAELRAEADLMPAAIQGAHDAIAEAHVQALERECDDAAAELRRINRELRALLDRAAAVMGRKPIPLGALYGARTSIHSNEDLVDPGSETTSDGAPGRAEELLARYRALRDRARNMRIPSYRRSYVEGLLERMKLAGTWDYPIPAPPRPQSAPWPPQSITITQAPPAA